MYLPTKKILALLFMLGSGVSGAEYRVIPSADPDVSPITAAIAMASAGDTILVEPGTYREHITLDKSIHLKGKPGAVLEGGRPLAFSFKKAGGDLPGVYVSVLQNEDRPYGLMLDGKIVAALRFDRAQEQGPWHWKTLLVKGTPLSGFKNIQALWLYHPDENSVYLRLPEDRAPDLSRLSWIRDEGPLVTFEGCDGATLENLTLQGGEVAVQFDSGSKNCTLRGCKILSFENTGVIVTGGSNHNLIEQNEITRGSLEDWTPSLEHDRANYEIWRIHKDVGHYDRSGIDLLESGAGNRILRNKIYLVFDGICIADWAAESLAKPLTDPDAGKDTEIAGNTIQNTRDSGMELGAGGININVHHNTLQRTHGGLRFKLPRIGPIFIHHNQFIDGSPFNIWFSMDSSLAEGYVYQNTFIGSRAALTTLLDGKQVKFTAPKWHFVNNLILTDGGFFQSTEVSSPRDFIEKGNVVFKDKRDVSAIPKDALKNGVDLSNYWNGKPLPGSQETIP